MYKSVRLSACLLTLIWFSGCVTYSVSQVAPKPLRRTELLALVAGGALPENTVHFIVTRGLSFTPSVEFREQLKGAGANDSILAALEKAKIPGSTVAAEKWEQEMLAQLASASRSMNNKKYDDAVHELTEALKASVSAPEVGFVMGAILRELEEWNQAEAVYSELLREDSNFPEAHTKLSYIR